MLFVVNGGEDNGEVLSAPEYDFLAKNKETLFEQLKLWGYEDLYRNRKISL